MYNINLNSVDSSIDVIQHSTDVTLKQTSQVIGLTTVARGKDGTDGTNGTNGVNGTNGTNDANYIKTFITTSVVDVNHNLNKLVSITVIDSANDEVVGDIVYIDMNNIRVTFSSAFSGTIICN